MNTVSIGGRPQESLGGWFLFSAYVHAVCCFAQLHLFVVSERRFVPYSTSTVRSHRVVVCFFGDGGSFLFNCHGVPPSRHSSPAFFWCIPTSRLVHTQRVALVTRAVVKRNPGLLCAR